MAQPFKPESLVLGIALIALGVLWTLANLGDLDLLGTLRRWWPATLVLWGSSSCIGRTPMRRTGRSQ